MERRRWILTLKELVCLSPDALALTAFHVLVAEREMPTPALLRFLHERQGLPVWEDAIAHALLLRGHIAPGQGYEDLIRRIAQRDPAEALALWGHYGVLHPAASTVLFAELFAPAVRRGLGDVWAERVLEIAGRLTLRGEPDFAVDVTAALAASDTRAAQAFADAWRHWLVRTDIVGDDRDAPRTAVALVRAYSDTPIVRTLDFGRRPHRSLVAARAGHLPGRGPERGGRPSHR
jgi:hypothetical protein